MGFGEEFGFRRVRFEMSIRKANGGSEQIAGYITYSSQGRKIK